MLSRETVPVWMLADAALGLLMALGMLTLMLAAPLASKLQPILDCEKCLVELAATKVELANRTRENARLNENLSESQARGTEQQRMRQQAEERMASVQSQLAQQQDSELKLRQELLELQGSLARTLFVIDISGSMGQIPEKPADRPNWGRDGEPWTFVKRKVSIWLQHLPVGSFRVICSNHELHEFPAVEQGWASGAAWRQKACEFLAQHQPAGGTFTEMALRRALEWKPTSIVLFTDGQPGCANIADISSLRPSCVFSLGVRMFAAAIHPRQSGRVRTATRRLEKILSDLKSIAGNTYRSSTPAGQRVHRAALAQCLAAISGTATQPERLRDLPCSTSLVRFLIDWLTDSGLSCNPWLISTAPLRSAGESEYKLSAEQLPVEPGRELKRRRDLSVRAEHQELWRMDENEIRAEYKLLEMRTMALPMAILRAHQVAQGESVTEQGS